MLRARAQRAHLHWRTLAYRGADPQAVRRAADELERAMQALRRAEERAGRG